MIALTLLSPGRAWWLLALVPLLVAYLVSLRVRRRQAVVLPTTPLLALLVPQRREWRRHAAAALLLVALATVVFATARPADAHRVPRTLGTVIVALDASRSMRAPDVRPSRLAAAQTAATDFIASLPRRIDVGVVTFAETATIAVRPGRDRAAAVHALRNVQVRDGTALGEAVYKALEATQSQPQQVPRGDPDRIALVILSDGDSTAGRTVEEAAAAATAAHLRVSTIAFGTNRGEVVIDGIVVPAPVGSDALSTLAEQSGGEHFSASTLSDLDLVYDRIALDLGTRVEHRELTSWVLAGAALLLLLALMASAAWSPKVP